MIRRNAAGVLVLLLLSPALSGCLGSEVDEANAKESPHWLPAVEERSELIYMDDDVSVSYTHLTLPTILRV